MKKVKRLWIRTVFVLLGLFVLCFFLGAVVSYVFYASFVFLAAALVLTKVKCRCPHCGFGGLSLAANYSWNPRKENAVCPKCSQPVEIEE